MSETSKKEQKDPTYKLLMLGDSMVGKTCFLMRYTKNTFQDVHLSTIGMDFSNKEVTLENGKIVNIQIWDTAGQERLRSLCKNLYKKANGIILMFDVTNKSSFDNIKNWVSQIKQEASEKVCVILVGNKIDDVDKREISKEEGEKTADEFGLNYFETSAKTGENVESSYYALIKKIDDNYSKMDSPGGTKLVTRNQRTSGCSC